MTLITMAALICCLLLMLSVTYAECHIKAVYAEYHYAYCRGTL